MWEMAECWAWKHLGEQPTIKSHTLFVALLAQVSWS